MKSEHLTNDEIGVAVESCLLVQVEMMALLIRRL